jgi:hypothetical protein
VNLDYSCTHTYFTSSATNYCFDSFPRCLPHDGTKGLTTTTSTLPIRLWAMSVTLLQLLGVLKGLTPNSSHTLYPLLMLTLLRPLLHSYYCLDYCPRCLLHGATNGLSTQQSRALTPLLHSHKYCYDYFTPRLLHGGTNALTTQSSRALEPVLHTLISLLPQQNYCFDSFPRCFLHGGIKGLTPTTSTSPTRLWAMPVTLLLVQRA